METPKCPYCEAELEHEYPIDSWYDHELYCERWKGFCEACDIDFKWTEVYIADGIINLERTEKGE